MQWNSKSKNENRKYFTFPINLNETKQSYTPTEALAQIQRTTSLKTSNSNNRSNESRVGIVQPDRL